MNGTEFDIPALNPVGNLGGLNSLAGKGGIGKDANVASDFESLLLHRLLEEMRKTVPESGLLESGITGQVEDLFWYYLAQEVARKGGLGLAEQLRPHLPGANASTPTAPDRIGGEDPA